MILNQISNKLRNTSDPVPESSDDVPPTYLPVAMELLSVSLTLILIVSVGALVLKHWLWINTPNSRTHYTPEGQARKRELNAHRFRRYIILFLFGILPFFMQIAVYCFFLGSSFTVESLGTKWGAVLGGEVPSADHKFTFAVVIVLFTLLTVCLLIWYGVYAFSPLFRDLKRILERVASKARSGPCVRCRSRPRDYLCGHLKLLTCPYSDGAKEFLHFHSTVQPSSRASTNPNQLLSALDPAILALTLHAHGGIFAFQT